MRPDEDHPKCKLAGKVYGQPFGVDVASGAPILGEPDIVLRAALEQTFMFRKTHVLPTSLPAPPSAWRSPYAAMAGDNHLSWLDLDGVTKAVQAFLDPVLAGGLDATWEPESGSWRSR